MSGIVGVFNFDRRPVTLSEVEALAAASPHRAADGQHFWICSSFGIGHQHSRVTPESLTEEQPLVSAAGTAVSFDGRLDNRQDLTDRRPPLAIDSQPVLSDAALVLAVYERSGDGFASYLNGDFAIALFDSRRRQLLLARDLMGARSLYYCALPGTLLFASEIKSLLADSRVNPRPDEDGIADLVLDKWDNGHQTCFSGIYGIPPGSMLVATTEKIVLRQHRTFDPTQEIRCQSLGEYAECFRSLFEQAVRRRLRSAGPVAVSVSGGVDSSSIFCQAAALRRSTAVSDPPYGIAMTFPTGSAADEQRYLDEIERAYGGRITRLAISELRLLLDADRVVGHLEMPGVFWSATRAVFESARRAGCSVVLDGYFGDHMLCGRSYLVDLARRGRWLKVHRDLREFAAWNTDVRPGFFGHEFRSTLLRSLPPRWLFQTVKRHRTRSRLARYPPWYRKEFLERLLDRQMNRFVGLRFASRHAEEYYRHATAGHDLTQVELESRAGLMHGVEVWYPFRDLELVAFMMAIPGEVVNAGGVPKGLLRHALTRILPDPIRNRRWKADFTPFSIDAVLREHANIARLLTRDCLSVRSGIVDGNLIEQSVRTATKTIAEAGDTTIGWQLTNLVGLELWLRHFFADQLGGIAGCTTS